MSTRKFILIGEDGSQFILAGTDDAPDAPASGMRHFILAGEGSNQFLLIGGEGAADATSFFGVTDLSVNANIFVRIKLTLRDIKTGSASSVWLTNREIESSLINHFPLLDSITGVGFVSGEFLPQSARAVINVNNSIASFGSERRFSDLLEYKTLIDQVVSIEVADISMGVETIDDGDFSEVWRARVSNISMRPGLLRISTTRSEIPIRTLTKVITSTNFPNAPIDSLGKYLPIVFSSPDKRVEVDPVRISSTYAISGQSRVDFAYATTLANQHIVSGTSGNLPTIIANNRDGNPSECALTTTPTTPILNFPLGGDWFPEIWEGQKELGFLIMPGQNVENGAVLVGCNFFANVDEEPPFTELPGKGFTCKVYTRGVNGYPGQQIESSFLELVNDNPGIEFVGTFFVTKLYRLRFEFSRPIVVGPTTNDAVFITLHRNFGEDEAVPWYRINTGSSIGSHPAFQEFMQYDTGSPFYDADVNSPDWQFSVKTQGRMAFELFGLGYTDTPNGGDSTKYEDGLGHATYTLRMRQQALPDLTSFRFTMQIKGLKDTSGGSITGVGSSYISTPRHVARLLLREWNGSNWVDTKFDVSKFSSTHKLDHHLGGKSQGRQLVSELLNNIMRNSASRLVSFLGTGEKCLALYSWGKKQNVVDTIDDERASLVAFDTQGTETIINLFQAAYDERLQQRTVSLSADGQFSQYFGFFDSSTQMQLDTHIALSRQNWGVRPLRDVIYNFIQGESEARHLAQYNLRWYYRPAEVVQIIVPFYLYKDLENMQVVWVMLPGLNAYYGTSYDTKLPVAGTEENSIDLVPGAYWKRAKRYRAQIEGNQLIFSSNQPLQRLLTLRLLDEVMIT